MHVHRSRLYVGTVAPHPFEKAVTRYHAIRVLHEVPEELELPAREPNRRAPSTLTDTACRVPADSAAVPCSRERQHGGDGAGPWHPSDRELPTAGGPDVVARVDEPHADARASGSMLARARRRIRFSRSRATGSARGPAAAPSPSMPMFCERTS